MKIKMLLISSLLSLPSFASDIDSIESLAGLKSMPSVGSIYTLKPGKDTSEILYCQVKNAYNSFSACQIMVTSPEIEYNEYNPFSSEKDKIPPMYLELGNNNYSGRNVSGMKIKFKKVKYGQLFFELIE